MLKSVLLASVAALALGGCATMEQQSPMGSAEVPERSEATANVAVPDNILLAEWTGPYDGVPPWDKVKVTDFPEAFQFAIDEQRREIAQLTVGVPFGKLVDTHGVSLRVPVFRRRWCRR